jgi:outer membrane protein assembly factor BamB
MPAIGPRRSIFVWLILIALAAIRPARAENWPQWRGANHNGVSHEKGLPAAFGKDKNTLWRVPLPGPAGATPIVWGDRVFLTSVDDQGPGLYLVCISTEGKELWRKKFGTGSSGNRKARGDEVSTASPSPSTDGKHIWAMLTTGDLACFDFDGNEAWHIDLQKRYGKFNIAYGMTATPVLDGDRLYVQLIHGDGNAKTREAIVVCLEKATGKEVWKQPRPSDAIAECEHSYASPTLYRDDTQAFLLTHGADYVVAHDLDTGKELWRCAGLNAEGPKSARYNPTLRFVATPVAVPGLIVVPSAKNGPVLGLTPGGSGDITKEKQYHVWRRPDNTPDVPSPLVHDGLVYLCRENGNLICIDAKTGQQYYNQRTHPQRHRASPVYADGKIYLTARDGVISVVQAGRDFKLLAENKLGEEIAASPAIAGGRIYLRTFDALYAVGEK